MTPRRAFLRKIAYLVAIAVLLVPLFWLSQPATSSVKGAKGSPGGYLARKRHDFKLSEAQLGEIDPTGETIKLATLGLRGVAANLLWEKANRHKMKKDWTGLSATLQQITKLEPHFIAVWRFQAWNLSYNVSAEFDDYRKRYEWVIKGIRFLGEGIRHNDQEARLIWDEGWFTGQKIGRADEHRQFRILFKQDDDFHGSRPPELRDNWLVGKESFARAERLVDHGAPLKMSPVIFYADRPMSQMNYSETLLEDGVFGDKAERSWDLALREWTTGPLKVSDQIPYGTREIPTSRGDVIRLSDRESQGRRAHKLRADLENMAPGLREEIAKEKRAGLSRAAREALDVPPEERTAKQHELASEAEWKTNVTHEEVAQRLTGGRRALALKLAEDLTEAERLQNLIRSYREIVNFEYWRRRAQVEQTTEALEAHRLIHEGIQAFAEADLLGAKQNFEAGFAMWRKVLDMKDEAGNPRFGNLVEDRTFGRDWMEEILRYRRILDAGEEDFPENFVLQDIIRLHHDSVEGWNREE